MKRRLKSFYEKKGFRSFSDLYCGLSKDAKLLEEILDRITINVSEFFRNRKHWEITETSILPLFFRKTGELGYGVPHVATGEKPYTFALILSKFMPLSDQIIATDIDEKALSKAKEGLFSERAVQEIPSELKRKYFSKKGDLYILSEDIKKTVIFKKHNLLADPYGGPYDLIICRNVLIYFTEEAKEMIYKKINKALTTGGIFSSAARNKFLTHPGTVVREWRRFFTKKPVNKFFRYMGKRNISKVCKMIVFLNGHFMMAGLENSGQIL